MRFNITFKTPDAISHVVRELAEKYNVPKPNPATLQGDISDTQDLADSVHAFTSNWIKHGEYVTIEFDTDAGTATVLKVSR